MNNDTLDLQAATERIVEMSMELGFNDEDLPSLPQGALMKLLMSFQLLAEAFLDISLNRADDIVSEVDTKAALDQGFFAIEKDIWIVIRQVLNRAAIAQTVAGGESDVSSTPVDDEHPES